MLRLWCLISQSNSKVNFSILPSPGKILSFHPFQPNSLLGNISLSWNSQNVLLDLLPPSRPFIVPLSMSTLPMVAYVIKIPFSMNRNVYLSNHRDVGPIFLPRLRIKCKCLYSRVLSLEYRNLFNEAKRLESKE